MSIPYNDNSRYAPSLGAFAASNPSEVVVFASAAQTTTQTQPDQDNASARGIILILDCTANAGGLGSVTLSLQGKDPASGKYYTILAGAAVTTVSTNVYRVYPALTAAANATASDVLPKTWRVLATANNANPITYSVGAILLP